MADKTATPGFVAGMKKLITGKGYVPKDYELPINKQIEQDRKQKEFDDYIKKIQAEASKIRLKYSDDVAVPEKKKKKK